MADKQRIMFDLETLGNTSNAPIVQIGACKFNDDGEILDTFLRHIDLESLDKYNFHVDYRTVGWWLSQSDDAIKSVFCATPRINLRQALHEFITWVGPLGDYEYWSHATFDPPILANNIKAVGMGHPIPFRAHRDIRTLNSFVGHIEVKREGIEHNALDDCIYQVAYVSKGLKLINKALTV